MLDWTSNTQQMGAAGGCTHPFPPQGQNLAQDKTLTVGQSCRVLKCIGGARVALVHSCAH